MPLSLQSGCEAPSLARIGSTAFHISSSMVILLAIKLTGLLISWARDNLAQRFKLMGLNHLLQTEFSFLPDFLIFRDILPRADHITAGLLARVDQAAMIGNPAIGAIRNLKTVFKLLDSLLRGQLQFCENRFFVFRMDVFLPEKMIAGKLSGRVSCNFFNPVADKGNRRIFIRMTGIGNNR